MAPTRRCGPQKEKLAVILHRMWADGTEFR
jgi:hypothetical protein